MEETKRTVASVKCLGVVAQVTIGYYDAEGNLIGEELFPQVEGNVLTAKLFHPHTEHLARLIETCIEQAWAKVSAQTPLAAPGANGSAEGATAPEASEVDRGLLRDAR